MSARSNVAPSTLSVDLVDGGIVVHYLDGREVFYHGPPERVQPPVRTPPGKEVHVLVTEPDGLEGVMTYVNDRKTHDDILESSGVGRVVLDRDERTTIFPGVEVATEGYSVRVDADLSTVDGRVFVFAEDELSEHAYELVADGREASVDEASGAPSDGGADGNASDAPADERDAPADGGAPNDGRADDERTED